VNGIGMVMKHLRQYIRGILTEGVQAQRLHHSQAEDSIDTGPFQQPGPEDQVGPKKPVGMWYDCGGEWKEFCDSDMRGYGNKGYDAIYEVVLNDSNMLFISTVDEFDAFEKEYGVKGRYDLVIDWKRVSESYDGIEICPYLKKRRQHFWYYGWDVASGCVWSPGAIKELKKLC